MVQRLSTVEESEFSDLHAEHAPDYVVHLDRGDTVHVALGNEMSIYNLGIRPIWVSNIRIDIYAVAAHHIVPQIGLCGHVAKFILRYDLSILLQVKIHIVIAGCKINLIYYESDYIDPEEDVIVAGIDVYIHVEEQIITPCQEREDPEQPQQIVKLQT